MVTREKQGEQEKKILIDIVFDFLRFKMERIRFFLSIFSLDSSNKCLFLSTKLFIKPLIQILNRNIISSIAMNLLQIRATNLLYE